VRLEILRRLPLSPGKLSKRVIGDRIAWLDKMVAEIRALPLDSYEEFSEDKRNVWAAESCLRRALEAIFDLGRHILAKGFGQGVTEYKQIASELESVGVLSQNQARLLTTLAGYRNRLVHFYHEVSFEELHEICRDDLGDLLKIRNVFLEWVESNPDRVDETL
jgi:uncharacterized protein YutE (UPF0331/DUF86 family)